MPDDLSAFANPIPEAVRRQIARAEQMVRDQGDPNAGQAGQGQPEQETPTVGKTEDGFQPEGQGQNQDQDQDQEQDPSREPAPQPRNDWQQKYLTLQGKYSAEVPQLNNQLRAQQQQIDNLQNMLASMQRDPAPAQASPKSKGGVAPEDVEAYGEDLVSAARRWARAEIAPELDQMRSRFAELEGRAQQTQTSVAQNAVERALDAEVADWRTINTSQEFLSWLDDTDPFTGRRRHDLLGDAYGAGNIPRTVAFFRAFQREHTALTQPARPRPSHTPQGAGRPTLDQLAAPGRGNAGDSGAQPERRTWSRDQITAFFRDKQRGVFDGREAEALRIEQDIFAAGSEGRVH